MYRKAVFSVAAVAAVFVFGIVSAQAGPLHIVANPAYDAAVALQKTQVLMELADEVMADSGISPSIESDAEKGPGDIGFDESTMSQAELYRMGKECFGRAWVNYKVNNFRISQAYSLLAAHYFSMVITDVD